MKQAFLTASVASLVLAGVGLAGVVRTPVVSGGSQASAASSATAAFTTTAFSPADPSTWSSEQLAAALTFTCVDVSSPADALPYAAAGYGGVGFIGSGAPADLAAQLARIRAAAPAGRAPMIWSDEEGGEVQRLSDVIYPLPSAKTMGTWSPAQINVTARDYGAHMRALGVPMDLAPDADLAIPGYYIDSEQRGFSAVPQVDAADVDAFALGLREGGVVPVVKHWPGHGQTANSHTGIVTTPPFSTLVSRDLVPFRSAFASGTSAVLVGHLVVPGLTERPSTPASESPRALAYLRAEAGPTALIITDSLDMASASSALGITDGEAAVRALVAGADVALSCDPRGVVPALTAAIDTGRLGRSAAVAKVRRLLVVKAGAGVSPRPIGGHDLIGVERSGTGSGAVEVHSLSQSSGYQAFSKHIATALGVSDPANWQFLFAPYAGDQQQDLYAVHLSNTRSGRVEVHVLSEASSYQTYLAHVATPLTGTTNDRWQFRIASVGGDRAGDLVAVDYAGTHSGHVEVHVLSAASGFHTWTVHAATALPTTVPGAWTFLIGDAAHRGDLVAIKRTGTESGGTEAHILSYDSRYLGYTLHRALPLAPTPQPAAEFSLTDVTDDGVPDLVLSLLQGTGSGRTELHVLGGVGGFTTWRLHVASALGPVSPTNWDFQAAGS